jgi:paraquat-inducible protein B
LPEARAKARIRATASAMPVAAETKFWVVSPTIWVRELSVLSPP